mgnify:CR=1 FL=1
MAFLSCEEMLAAARSQKITLAEAVLRSDLEESRLTEVHSRAAMRHLWQVMQATSQEYDPAQRSRSGLSGGDAAKVEQAWQQGRLLGDDYLAAVTAEALKTAECNACMKRIVAAPTAGSCGVLPARRTGRRGCRLRRTICSSRLRAGHRRPRHAGGRRGRLSG